MHRMERTGTWHRPFPRDRTGQASLEYVVVLCAFLAMVVALIALWRWLSAGGLLGTALGSASHSIDAGLVDALQDVLLF